MSSLPRRRSALFEHGGKRIELSVQRTHLGTFLFGWHWNIGDVYIHSSGLIPSMQLRCAAYHVFESRRDVDHFIAIAFCKANAGFSSRGGKPDACFATILREQFTENISPFADICGQSCCRRRNCIGFDLFRFDEPFLA